MRCFAKGLETRRRLFLAAVSALVPALVLADAAPARAVVVSIGHRGASAIAPENTVAAVEAAYGDAWGVECDPRVTSDGAIIMMHDANVKRTTGVDRLVANMTLAEIRQLDAGSWFSPAFAGEKVPTLQEQFDATFAGGMVACLDIKSGTPQQYLPHIQPYRNQIEIHSFSWSGTGNFIEGLAALDDDFTFVALGSGDLLSQLPSLPSCIDKVSWYYPGITAAGVAAAHAAGIQVYAWTVNNVATMLNLERMGVDGIVTDHPALASSVLNQPPPVPGEGLPRRLHDGLMMNWTFDDALGGGAPTTVADGVNGVDATLGPNFAVPESWQTAPNAKLGGALKFAGSGNDYATVPAAVETVPLSNAVTLAAWVKLDALPSNMPYGYGSIYDSNQDTYVFYLDKTNNELRFKVTAGAAARPGIPGAQLDTTNWHLVTGVYDGGAGVARIYLDGNLIDVHADDDAVGSDGLVGGVGLQNAFFGSNGTALNGFFKGIIDETTVWGRALGEAEIKYLHNGGAGRTVLDSNLAVQTVDPVVRLEFEGGLGNWGSGGAALNGQWVDGSSGYRDYEPGVNGQALHLHNPISDSGGDAVAVPVTLADAGTISFWCKPDSFYGDQTLFDNVSDQDDWEMFVNSSGLLTFRLEDDSTAYFDMNLLDQPLAWHHLAITWFKAGSDAVLNLYVDGLLRDIDEGAWVAPGNTLYIGGGNPGNVFANASFDDFRVYDTILATDEIAAIFFHKEVGVPGDANGDGRVDDVDASRLAENWGATGANRLMGDFNDDGRVDASDAAILAANWGHGVGELHAVEVPEPAMFIYVVAAMMIAAATGRKQRLSNRNRILVGT